MNPATIARRIPADQLRDFVLQAFCEVGCCQRDASEATNVLMWASLRGVDTHGIRNLWPYYLRGMQSGELEAIPRITTQNTSPTTIRLDGGGGMGLVTASRAMKCAIQKANERGVGIATVQNSHHLGPAGYFASMALEQEMLGVCVSGHFFGRGNPIGVPPINSLQAMFSTNPISLAAPTGDRPPFLLDMATATTTVNRIESFAQLGQSIPSGWAKDAAGNATNEPKLATLLNPLGCDVTTSAHKGVALSMLASILTGVLSGAWSESNDHDREGYEQETMGHFLAAIRVDQFMPVEQFKSSMDAMIDALLSAPPLDPSEPIHYPGSREHATLQERLREGIPVDFRLLEELQQVRRSLSLTASLE